VVRRDRDASGRGHASVGIRGRTRAQRYATWIDADQCATVVTPVDIARAGFWRLHPRRDEIPALRSSIPSPASLAGCRMRGA
jgi:phosphoribosyl-dephospho-CoA transferase